MKIVLSLAISLASASVIAAQTVRISTRVDSRMVALVDHVHPLARPNADRGAVDPAMDLEYLTLHFRSTDAQQAALERLLEEQRDPSSPNYHRWLSPEEFGDHFGLGDADLATISNWLRDQGFRMHGAARGRRWISFGGTAGQVQRAFHTEIHHYQVDGKLHYANATAPQVPAAFEGVVAGLLGLDDFEPEPASHKSPVTLDPAFTNTAGDHFLSPDDVSAIYNIKPLYDAGFDGSGQKIAVGGRTLLDLSDYRLFRRRFNLPANDPTLIVVPGSDPGNGSAADMGESNLDIQWASAIAPKAAILLVYARSTNTAAQYAIDQNLAPVFTLSYGACEQSLLSSTVTFVRGIAQQANAQGITWVTSTGDVGAAGCERQDILTEATRGLAVQFPAAIPEITAVGGTEFDEGDSKQYWNNLNTSNSASATGYIPERGWNDSQLLRGLASSTGGMSVLFPKPAWQTGLGVPAENARAVPDLALASSFDHDGWLTYVGGSLGAYGGTSVATPVFAGILSLLNQALTSRGVIKQPGLGNINPTLYRMAQSTSDVFHDIVNGDNMVPCAQGSPDCVNGTFGYTAGPGYDLVTGLGSINVLNFVNRWNTGTASATSVTASPSSVPFNGTVQLTATVSGGGAPAGGTINFLVNGAALGSAPLSSGTGTLSVSAFKLPAGASTITAVYGGNNLLNGSSATTRVTVTLPSSGSAVVPSITPDPIFREAPDTNGFSWFFTITLSERAGVATTLTGLQILGTDYSSRIGSFFGTANIGPRGSIQSNLAFRINNPPVTGAVIFNGVDADGRTWTQQITAQFLSASLQEPWVTVATAPGIGDSRAPADPSCRLQDQVILIENSGYEIGLTRFAASTSDLTSQIQQIFGATHLAPYGTLFGTVCWDNTPAASARYSITGTTESGVSVVASGAVTAVGAPSPAAPFTISPSSVSLAVSGPSQSASAPVSLNLPGAAKWSVSIYPANRATNWLSVSPLSGTGPAQISVRGSSNGLSNGVYDAILTIQAQGTLPQYINVPISFVNGAGGGVQIGGVANGASFKTVFAPGMVLSVFGTNLSPGIESAARLPLPISMQGVTATVNGVTAPLYFVSSGQINLQIPYETGAGPAVLGINNNGRTASFMFTVSPAAPGIFTGANAALVPFNTGRRGAVLLAFITGEGDLNPFVYTGRTPFSNTPLNQLPKPRLPVTISVGGVNATIAFVGLPPGLSGVTQINFTVPSNAPLGDQPVVVSVGGSASAAARLTVTQ